MIKKRYFAIALGVVSALFAGLLVNNVILAQSGGEYDPWIDTNDDGIIEILDLTYLGEIYGTAGTPINKTELLFDLLDRVPRAGNISVPAAAFVPWSSTTEWYILGGTLYNNGGGGLTFYAPVQLPHGATVTNLTSCWYDKGNDYVFCRLQRYDSEGVYNWTAVALSTGVSGYGSSTADSINPATATVDNNQYGYSLEVNIPYSASHSDYLFHLAIIEYEYQ